MKHGFMTIELDWMAERRLLVVMISTSPPDTHMPGEEDVKPRAILSCSIMYPGSYGCSERFYNRQLRP